jgi:hypothetical protein
MFWLSFPFFAYIVLRFSSAHNHKPNIVFIHRKIKTTFSPYHIKHHHFYSKRISQTKLNINRCQYKTKSSLEIYPYPPNGLGSLIQNPWRPMATHGSVEKLRCYQNPPIALLSDPWVTHGLIKNQTPVSLNWTHHHSAYNFRCFFSIR